VVRASAVRRFIVCSLWSSGIKNVSWLNPYPPAMSGRLPFAPMVRAPRLAEARPLLVPRPASAVCGYVRLNPPPVAALEGKLLIDPSPPLAIHFSLPKTDDAKLAVAKTYRDAQNAALRPVILLRFSGRKASVAGIRCDDPARRNALPGAGVRALLPPYEPSA
jgi:hypothetical protein